jgi:tRNA-specific 2-thiouridylase
VTTDLNDDTLWKKNVELQSVHWINDAPNEGEYKIRVRHRAPLINATIKYVKNGNVELQLKEDQRAIAAGQSVVIYDDATCVGGGIVT